MKIILILLTVFSLGFCGSPRHLEAKPAGVVTEVKVLNVDDQETVSLWVSANKEYIVKGKHLIPPIAVGDTLFEYWADYRKIGVGTKRDLIIYEVEEDSREP